MKTVQNSRGETTTEIQESSEPESYFPEVKEAWSPNSSFFWLSLTSLQYHISGPASQIEGTAVY